MSSKTIFGDEEKTMQMILLSPPGVTWEQIAEGLNIQIDQEKAVREKLRRRVNGWIARKFGRGENKTVYSVWSSDLDLWVYKNINAMTKEELGQALVFEQKNLDRAVKRMEMVKHRKIEIEVLMSIKELDFSEERLQKPA